MANFGGQGTTVNLDEIFEDLEAEIKMIGWSKARLFARLRKVEDSKQLKHEWVEDEFCPTSTTLAAVRVATSLLATLTHAFRIRKFEICRIGKSVVRVIDIKSGATISFTSVGGDTLAAESHSAGTVVIACQVGQLEGADPQDGIQTSPSTPYNYLEQFEDKLDMTDVRSAIAAPGAPEWTRQWKKKMREHAQRMENAFVYGVAQAPSASAPALVGGLWDWISTNEKKCVADGSQSLTTEVTEVIFEEYMGKAFEAGGNPNLIVTNVVGMRALNTWYRSYYAIDKAKGPVGIHTTKIITSFGDLEIVLDPLLKTPAVALGQAAVNKAPGVIVGLDMSRLGVSHLQKEGTTRRIPLARTGSARKEMLRTIATLVKKNETAHFKILNFAVGG